MSLTAARHRRLRQVFDRVLSMDAAARTPYVQAALADDPDLQSRCLRLLNALEWAGSFLEAPVGRRPD